VIVPLTCTPTEELPLADTVPVQPSCCKLKPEVGPDVEEVEPPEYVTV
jgi:hypothetical protein